MALKFPYKTCQRHFTFFLIFFFICSVAAAQQITINGYVSDATTGERLIGVNIREADRQQGASTNIYGFFSIPLKAGNAKITVSYVGFKTDTINGTFSEDSLINIKLFPDTYQLKEVEISGGARQESLRSPEMSILSLRPQEIKNLPALMGETDVLKAIQLLPGIQAGQEGFSDLIVRGGGLIELLLLDGVTVYNSSHLLGFISIYDANTIKRVDVMKGGFPARYGGRLSSIIDIHLKEGNNQKISGEGSIGLISSKILLEGPVKGEQTSFLLSVRRTYLDALAVMAQGLGGQEISSYNFHDAVFKINHTFSKRDRVYLSLYGGRDKFFTNYSYDPLNKESFRLFAGEMPQQPFAGTTFLAKNFLVI